MQPLELGCDISLHSTTKYLNGHSDVVGGAIVAKTQAHHERLEWWANCAGVTGAPFDAYQTLRGLRTLPLRMDAQEANAIAIAKFLKTHKAVSKVYYPDAAAASIFAGQTKLFRLAASLGGVESLICQPSIMTHRGMTAEARAKAGISESLLRVSVGIESQSDLIADLRQSLAHI